MMEDTKPAGAGSRPGDGTTAASNLRGMPKRVFTPASFFSTIGNILASSPALIKALFKTKTSAVLREKIFLAVSSINDCRYCSWGHSHWALARGVSLEEVNQILSQQTDELLVRSPSEAAAILFAQHYAEFLERFEPESVDNLRQYYSQAQIAEILGYVRLITFGNLAGNTFDALLERLRGKARAPNSNPEAAAKRTVGTRWPWWLPFGTVPEISPLELDALCQDGSAPPQLVDVRTDSEWRAGHIAGAMHVPITELGSRIAGLHLDGTRPIVAICRSAHRSVPAVRLLQRSGFHNACQLQGGMLAWQQAELPVDHDNDPAAPVI